MYQLYVANLWNYTIKISSVLVFDQDRQTDCRLRGDLGIATHLTLLTGSSLPLFVHLRCRPSSHAPSCTFLFRRQGETGEVGGRADSKDSPAQGAEADGKTTEGVLIFWIRAVYMSIQIPRDVAFNVQLCVIGVRISVFLGLQLIVCLQVHG